MNRVSITNVEQYNQAEVTNSIKRHFELLEVASEIRPEMTVLIKPNLLMKRKPEEATTTHPAVVAGVIECLQEIGVTNIVIADSPGGLYTKQALSGIYKASGMEDIALRYGVQLNQDFTSYEQTFSTSVLVNTFTLIAPVKQADYIIDIAKLKTHAMTTLSGAVKNMFGTIPGLLKPEFHFRFPDRDDFSEMLVDLCVAVKPNLSIVDAIVSMEGDGPSGGTPRNTGLILASKNPYNLDVALCSLIGVELSSVPTVVCAMNRKLCVDNENNLLILGDCLMQIDDYLMPTTKQVDFTSQTPKLLRWIVKPFFERFLVSKPVIHRKKCIGCGKCAEICPAQIIKIVSGKAVIKYDKCIKCFCCHEMCPPKAIEISRFMLFKHR